MGWSKEILYGDQYYHMDEFTHRIIKGRVKEGMELHEPYFLYNFEFGNTVRWAVIKPGRLIYSNWFMRLFCWSIKRPVIFVYFRTPGFPEFFYSPLKKNETSGDAAYRLEKWFQKYI